MPFSLNMKLILLWPLLLTFNYSTAQENDWNGFKMEEFEIEGRKGKIVFPKQANKKRLWIWRARFWGHEPQVDIALLSNGFHLVYVDVANLFGNDLAVNIWNRTYKFVSQKYQLHPKAVLEGMSRGGLIVYNWTAKNTDKVACIYVDAPVCDIKSWPGGMGKGKGAKTEWKACLSAYQLTTKKVKQFKGNPVDHAALIAKANIPVIHVCGDADKVVPMEENTLLFKERYEQAGGKMHLIPKKGIGHHPHCLEDPQPIVDFILANTL